MKILLTYFDPFGKDTLNSSQEACRSVPVDIDGHEVHKMELPTEFGTSSALLFEALEKISPDIVICTGQAGGSSGIRVERVALNIDDSGFPDNKGDSPSDRRIFEDGEAAYFATLPVKAVLAALKEREIPGGISNSAGTYVCNHVMYALLYWIDKNKPGTPAGFLHIPSLPEQTSDPAKTPNMTAQTAALAIRTAIDTAAASLSGINGSRPA